MLFVKNYSVTLAEKIIPATDLSEQISTAGMEASGTGNMKFQLNGALTIGTLDGANIEIMEEVGKDNIFIFGLTAEEVENYKKNGYNPYDFYNNDEDLRKILEMIRDDYFSPMNRGFFCLYTNYCLVKEINSSFWLISGHIFNARRRFRSCLKIKRTG